jgi:hypothetical protein
LHIGEAIERLQKEESDRKAKEDLLVKRRKIREKNKLEKAKKAAAIARKSAARFPFLFTWLKIL